MAMTQIIFHFLTEHEHHCAQEILLSASPVPLSQCLLPPFRGHEEAALISVNQLPLWSPLF